MVQEALETTFRSEVYLPSLTPMTNMGASAEGAEMTTFFAPPFRWAEAFSTVVKTPVDSTIYSAPQEPQLISAGSAQVKTEIAFPLTTSLPSRLSTVPSKRPCMVSYRTRYAI